MAGVEVAQTLPTALGNVEKSGLLVDDDPKAALAAGLPHEDEDQILFSCNICYDVSEFYINLASIFICYAAWEVFLALGGA